MTRFSMPLGARHWHYPAELRTLSVTYPLCGLALTDSTDNPSEMCPLKLTDFCLFCTIDHTQSYKGHLFPQWLSQVVAISMRYKCYTVPLRKIQPAKSTIKACMFDYVYFQMAIQCSLSWFVFWSTGSVFMNYSRGTTVFPITISLFTA